MFKIGNRKIGKECPVFIVAEMSANHLQKFDIAVKIIKKAKWAGADAIKLQTFTPDTITINCNNEYFRIKQGIWKEQTLYELYKKAYMPWGWQPKLKEIAEEEGLIFFSTPSDKTSVDFLENINVPAYKVASLEITDIPLIEYIALKGKPVILSLGIANYTDMKKAVRTCRKQSNSQVAVLKCVSVYPTPLEEVNLKTITFLKDIGVVTGISDHTLSTSIPVASVALGASIIEKHLTLDRGLGGPDATFSLEPDEFKIMVESVREVEKALGKVTFDLTAKMKKGRELTRSLFVVEDIKAGEVFTEKNIRSIRPGYGLSPVLIKEVIGNKAVCGIKKGTPLNGKLVKKG